MPGERHKIRGQVQGVGFRPTVWRVARELGLTGNVRNTGDSVEVLLWGKNSDSFVDQLRLQLPPLAKIDDWERAPVSGPAPETFSIEASLSDHVKTSVTPDTNICADCLAEIRDPFERRYRYPFANCTNCGPRFSIIESVPYDRDGTTMRSFDLCPDCAVEYRDPADRRFHAQPVACHACGPRAWLEKLGGGTVNSESFSMMDDVDAAGGALMRGFILAIKGIGGFHLACDATKPDVVNALRERKNRKGKAFALMARDLDVISQYAAVSDEEAALLRGPEAPIVLLRAQGKPLPEAIAPGLDRLGFMLPHTPLHHLLLSRMKRPVVMTSGNLSGQPQCTRNTDARRRLTGIADFALMHNRTIANRIDDSVVRVDMGRMRMLRRARGYTPKAIPLPKGFSQNHKILALGAELKNAFSLVKEGQAILSQHMGDMEDFSTQADIDHTLALYQSLYRFSPDLIAVDSHPEYLSTKRGYAMARDLPIIEVQHHHAHIASCLVENGYALNAPPVLGIALDGLGLGDDGTFWGGEFLIADYQGYQRAGCLKPVALPGGDSAVREPWRNAYAHLMAEMGWAEFEMNFSDLELYHKLNATPRKTLDAMILSNTNAPLSSSCGRLFDAAATMIGIAWERQDYEGQAAMQFEAILDVDALNEPDDHAYPFAIPLLGGAGLPYIEPLAVWRAMLGDLILGTPVGVMSARFHRGLAKAIAAMTNRITSKTEIDTVVLTGGCFQNATLFRLVSTYLKDIGLTLFSHSKIPANDGGLALGQAAIALALNSKGDNHVPRDTRTDH